MNSISLYSTLALFAIPSMLVAAPTPVIEENFNLASEWAQSPHVLVPSATAGVAPGVSGLPGDYALDLRSNSTMGGDGKQGYGFVYSGANPLNNSQSFTITGWYNASAALGNGARLLDLGPISVFFNDNQLFLRVTKSGTNYNASSGAEDFLNQNVWTFFAISYDSTLGSDNVNFYAGSSVDEVSLIRTFGINPGTIVVETDASRLNIGGRLAGDYNFKGLIDDIRIYSDTEGSGGVLDLAQLESVRTGALVPEPTTTALISAGCVITATALLRRRRR